MTAIGGFFELESRRGRGAWHTGAVALTSGRACLRAILEITHAARVLVPFYICDAALEPMRRLGIPFEFYGLTPDLEPAVTGWPADADVLYVNYFDMKNAGAEQLAKAAGDRAIVDDTQAFFRRGRNRSWSFNSARKFFGVPDGAYAYGPRVADIHPGPANDAAPAEHLTTRMKGDQQLGYQQYVAAEGRVSCDVLAPSPLAQQILDGVAYGDARAARRRNFALLHERLADRNTLALDFSLDADAAPFCYPFLPLRGALHQSLWQREIFVPRLWPEVVMRPADGFEWERDLASRLLPLPIDHRYGSDDMARVTGAVLEAAA